MLLQVHTVFWLWHYPKIRRRLEWKISAANWNDSTWLGAASRLNGGDSQVCFIAQFYLNMFVWFQIRQPPFLSVPSVVSPVVCCCWWWDEDTHLETDRVIADKYDKIMVLQPRQPCLSSNKTAPLQNTRYASRRTGGKWPNLGSLRNMSNSQTLQIWIRWTITSEAPCWKSSINSSRSLKTTDK